MNSRIYRLCWKIRGGKTQRGKRKFTLEEAQQYVDRLNAILSTNGIEHWYEETKAEPVK